MLNYKLKKRQPFHLIKINVSRLLFENKYNINFISSVLFTEWGRKSTYYNLNKLVIKNPSELYNT